MNLADLDFELPPGAIAQTPTPERDAARLLVIDRSGGALEDRAVGELPDLLAPGDGLVVNDSRVIPARVPATDGAGRAIEVLFVEAETSTRWRVLVRPGRRCRPGVELAAGTARLRVVAVQPDGMRLVERLDGTVDDLLAARGLTPLPPYIRRFSSPTPEDSARYQTVYARPPGSVAAPTAGLHFSDRLLRRLRDRGVEIHALTLHVGPGTFRPVTASRLEDHVVPPERAVLSPATACAVNRARSAGRRIVAVGTTTTRVLESAARPDGSVAPLSGAVGLTIVPGYRFRVVDALLTNFHLPRSSLLALVAAFAGRERILEAYAHAVRAGYRFYSYGDATLLV